MSFTEVDVVNFNKKAAADPGERRRWVEWANSYLKFQGDDRGQAAAYANSMIARERRRRHNPDEDLRQLLHAAAGGDVDAARRFRFLVKRILQDLDLETAVGLYRESRRVRESRPAMDQAAGQLARANIDLIGRIHDLGGTEDDYMNWLGRSNPALPNPPKVAFLDDWRGEHGSGSRFQSYHSLYAYDPTSEATVFGRLDYSTYDHGRKIRIEIVETRPEFRRQGVATLLAQELRRRHPGAVILKGYLTDDGAAFDRGVRRKDLLAKRARPWRNPLCDS